jgi:V/A-type H+-transporting ATPase subunit K
MGLQQVRKKYLGRILIVTLIVGGVCASSGVVMAAAMAGEAPAPAAGVAVAQQAPTSNAGLMAIAVALAVGLPCIGAGYAVGHVGAAALGAASEKPEMLMRSMLFVALAEGIAIYGVLMGILLLAKM